MTCRTRLHPDLRAQEAAHIAAMWPKPDATYLRLARERIATGVRVEINHAGELIIIKPNGNWIHVGRSPSLARLTYLAAVERELRG